jgi:PEGA domain
VPRPFFRSVASTIAIAASLGRVLFISSYLTSASGLQQAASVGTLEFEVKDANGVEIDGARFDFSGSPDGPAVASNLERYGKLTVQLPQGTYELTVVEHGFKDLHTRVIVRSGETQTFEVVMELAVMNECRGTCDPPVFSDDMVIEPVTAPMPQLIGRCSEHEKIAEIRPADRAYGYARELERLLDERGIMVRCMCASKLTEIFQGQAGAAWYRTDEGAFDVLFLRKGRTFAGVKIVQRRLGGAYRTSFAGRPQSAVRFDGSAPTYYIKRANVLISVGTDEKLAALLESKLQK